MLLKFVIKCKKPQLVAEAMRDCDPIHSGQVRFSASIAETTETEVQGFIRFDAGGYSTENLLSKAEETIRSMLCPYAFVYYDDYSLSVSVDS